MIKVPLPRHLEAQTRRRLQPIYTGKRKFSDPSDTLPSAEARSKARYSYLYQGGKWVPEDDGFSDKEVTKNLSLD